MSATRAYKLTAILAGAILIFLIGCTPGSGSSSSSDSSASAGNQVAANPTPGSGGPNDPAPDPPGGSGSDPSAGDPGTDPPGDGASAGVPEPATGLLFLCAAGSMTLARLRARKRA
jgi:hypothetical protein